MPNPVYPLSFYVEVTGYAEELADGFEETEMEEGPPRRDAKDPDGDGIACVVWYNAADSATLEAFFKTTLVGGTLPFDAPHPVTRANATLEFMKKGLKRGLKSSVWQQWHMRLRVVG